MVIKKFTKLNLAQSLEYKIKDSQQNLHEFTLMTSKGMDFSTFDILSVTRADTSPGYSFKSLHRKTSTQAARVISHSAQIIPLPKK